MAKACADPTTLAAAKSLAQQALGASALQAVSSIFSGRRRLAGDQVRSLLSTDAFMVQDIIYMCATKEPSCVTTSNSTTLQLFLIATDTVKINHEG